MAQVKLDQVTKQYEDVTAVDGMNLEIEDGEFVTFVGPSGCGKSTTMETIAGLTIPTGGDVYIGDENVTNKPPKDRGISMVFQNIALFPHMDVHETSPLASGFGSTTRRRSTSASRTRRTSSSWRG